jgi:hypothetical protein
MTARQRTLLEPLLARALTGYRGVLLSGGTAVGMPGIVGAVSRRLGLRAIGYVPDGRGERALYAELRETGGGEFSVREPLAMWSDILAARVPAGDVRLVACPGGSITRGEVALARALGACVGWLDPAGEAPGGLGAVLPCAGGGVLELPADPMTVRALVCWPTPSERLAPELRAALARQLRLAGRGERSTLAFVDAVPGTLALVGRRLARSGARLALSGDELELLAEAEHGRAAIERLGRGSRPGAQPLRPWSELGEHAKEYDRRAVRTIDAALAAAGWGVTDE